MAKPPTAPLSAERQALQAAFNAKLARDAEHAAVQAAFDRSIDAVHDAFGLVTSIERDIRERPQQVARQMVGATWADEPEPETVRELRVKLANAEADAEDAQKVRAELRKQLDAFEGWKPTTDRLRAAAAAVLRAETAELVESTVCRVEALTTELAQHRAILSTLQSAGAFGKFQHEVPARVSQAIAPLQNDVWRNHTAATASCPLATALDALMADPAATIPSV